MSNSFAVLGVHGANVPTVEGNVVRVRMFIGERMIDEDFPIPPQTIEEQLDSQVQARMIELANEEEAA